MEDILNIVEAIIDDRNRKGKNSEALYKELEATIICFAGVRGNKIPVEVAADMIVSAVSMIKLSEHLSEQLVQNAEQLDQAVSTFGPMH
jgi:hypothetical protein